VVETGDGYVKDSASLFWLVRSRLCAQPCSVALAHVLMEMMARALNDATGDAPLQVVSRTTRAASSLRWAPSGVVVPCTPCCTRLSLSAHHACTPQRSDLGSVHHCHAVQHAARWRCATEWLMRRIGKLFLCTAPQPCTQAVNVTAPADAGGQDRQAPRRPR